MLSWVVPRRHWGAQCPQGVQQRGHMAAVGGGVYHAI